MNEALVFFFRMRRLASRRRRLYLGHGVGALSEEEAEDHRVVPAGHHGGDAGCRLGHREEDDELCRSVASLELLRRERRRVA